MFDSKSHPQCPKGQGRQELHRKPLERSSYQTWGMFYENVNVFWKMWMFFENVNVLWKCLYGGSDSYQTCKSVWMSTIINVSVWFYVLKDWCRKDSGSRTSLFKMLGQRFVFYEKRLRNVKVKMEVFMGFATCLYYLKCFHWLLTMMVMKMMMMILMFIIIIMFMMMR